MSSMSFTLRPCRTGDEPGVCAAVKAVYDEHGFTWDPADYHADLHNLASSFEPPGRELWVCDLDGKVVGCAGVGYFEPLAGSIGRIVVSDDTRRIAGTDCELLRLYVHPLAQGRGLGRALFEQCIESAAGRGSLAMEIWSDKRFQTAHRLYQLAGAKVVGDRICDDPDQSPEWGLILNLA